MREKSTYLASLVLLLLIMSGCGPSSSELSQAQRRIKELESEVATLRTQLEEVEFGAPRLLGRAKAALQAKQDADAKKLLVDLRRRHPESQENSEAEALLNEIQAREDERERLEIVERTKKEEEARLALDRATRNMKKNTDEIKGITWITHKNAPVLGKYVSLYFGSSNGSAKNYPLRMKLQYSDDDWLFVRSVTVKADDKVYELGSMDFQRDNGSGTIWEWVDLPVEDLAMVSHWMSAAKVVVRFNGDKYYDDLTLTAGQRTQMREVFDAWRGMGGSR